MRLWGWWVDGDDRDDGDDRGDEDDEDVIEMTGMMERIGMSSCILYISWSVFLTRVKNAQTVTVIRGAMV